MKYIFPESLYSLTSLGFSSLLVPTVNKQASDKEGNLFFSCHFSERERQQERGGERERRERRRAHHVTAHNSEIDRIWQNYPGRTVRGA